MKVRNLRNTPVLVDGVDQIVAAGEVIDVDDALGVRLCEQPARWEHVAGGSPSPAPEAPDTAATVVTDPKTPKTPKTDKKPAKGATRGDC